MLEGKFIKLSGILILLCSLLAIKECKCRDITELSDVQKIYFQEHQFDYLENVFIKNLSHSYSYTDDYCDKVLIIIFLLLILFLIIGFATTEYLDIGEKITYSIYAIIFSFILIFIINLILCFVFEKKVNNERVVNTLSLFLDKYNTDQEYKKLIPDKYINSFQLLNQEYIKHGKSCLNVLGLDVIETLIDDLKYNIRKCKYKQISKDKSDSKTRNYIIGSAAFASSIIASRR